MKKVVALLLMGLALPVFAGGSFLINEFQYDPDPTDGDANGDGIVNTTQDEFVEIFNNSGNDVDVSGWTLSDGNGVIHTFPANSVVLSQCALVVFGGGTPTGAFGGSIVQTASSGSLALGNSGDSITLNDGVSDLTTVSYVDNQSDDESLTRDPDISGVSFVPHSSAVNSGGALFSPGTLIDSSRFSGCPVAVDSAPEVISTVPENTSAFVPADSTLSINFDEPIDATLNAVELTCDGQTQTFTGLPFSGPSLIISPDVDLPFDGSCAVTVVAAEITDQDGTVDNMVVDYAFSFTVRPMNLPVIINEFQYDPDGTNGDANGDGTINGSQDEFIELYNNFGADLDVSGWTISDAVQLRHTFPSETIVPANCAIVVFGGGTPNGVFGEAVIQTASSNSLGLNNGNDTITINNGNDDVASFEYNGEGNNEAATLDPDITGLTYTGHSSATASGGSLFSPGTRIDGTQFMGCAAVVDTSPSVTSTDPADGDVDVVVDSDLLINFDESVDVTANGVILTCDAAAQAFTGLPFSGTSLVISPDSDLPFDAVCAVTVLAAEVTDQDGTADNMAQDFSFDFTVASNVPAVIDVIVNEYQADPDAINGDANGDGTVDTSEDEFIEIYNNSADLLDISGWTVSDAVGVRHTFVPGTTLDGCRAIVVFGGGSPTGAFGGSQAVVASEGFLGLNNGGDSIIINDGVSDQVNIVFGSASTNQSYTLDPDITGLSFVEHSTATGSQGSLYSPGTRIDGSSFVPCGNTPTPPRVNSSVPINGAGGVDLDTNIEINFSENVNATVNAATLTCGASPVTFSGLPLADVSQLIINPDTDLPNGATCTLELIATEITDLDDSIDELDGNGDGTAGDNYILQFIAGFPEVEIYQIQGAGLVTPFNGITVNTTANIVTALDTNGFYMQTPDARDDNVLATSNGMFVFTGGAPNVAVGDLIDVTGDVVEFFDSTQMASSASQVVTVISNGNPLPTALILNDFFPSTDPAVFDCGDEALARECLEGMYFEMPQGFVSAASVGFFGGDRDDVFVKAGSSRAVREPGIDFPGIQGLPEFDGNPELIEMSIEALGLPFQALSAGTEFSAKGVIAFGFGDYELQPSEVTIINENVIPSSVRDQVGDEVTVASANLFRLFNDVDDPGSADDDQIADPTEYAARLTKLAQYFIEDMKQPTIIALQEIENISVLQDLATAINNAGGPNYISTMVEGNDVGGINVAYMYQAGSLSNVVVTQLGKNEINPFDSSLLHDRPPLRLEADVLLSEGTQPLNLLVVHMRSRSSIDSSSDGDRVRNKRLNQANSVALMVEGILNEDPDKPLYVLGDYNAFQFTDGYVDVVGQITGTAVAADNLLWSEPLFANAPLTQSVQTLAEEDQYSFIFRGSAQVLDNAIMNDVGLMDLVDMQFVRGQVDANVNFEDDDTTSLRSTDHDGFVLFIFDDKDLIFKNGFE